MGLGLVACGQGNVPSDGPSDSDLRPKGFAAPLTQKAFDGLSPEERYQVANKLLGTLWRGVPVDSFFDLSRGLDKPSVAHEDFLEQTRRALSEPLSAERREAAETEIFGLDAQGNRDPEQAKYRFDDERLPKQEPLARIVEYPLSRDMFAVWMAHFLANTIMFSPALEMESTNINDAQRVMASLERKITDGQSVREIVRGHLPTLSRWRVSRSPENHALEAFELYLGLFDTEEDSRKGGIACKDFYLTDEDMGYELVQTPFANSRPQVILDQYYITNCDDLYNVIVSDPRFMPRVVEVIVNYLMAGRSAEDRLAMVESIVKSGPETFEDIFKAILFSREYLLGTRRVQAVDENLFGTLARLKWSAYPERGEVDDDIFRRMTRLSYSQMYLDNMGWATMEYKIGRQPDVPMDALSFANYHKAMRERVLLQHRAYDGNHSEYPGEHGLFYRRDTEDLYSPLASLDLREFVDYVFLTGARRFATDAEKAELLDLARQRYWVREGDDASLEWVDDNRADDFARAIFDYISRLPELYYYRAVQ
ncbi:hypothetical protein [Thiohalorhabdus methylotrophus]|uniref:DUF1800 domain-containing protein n=1 Tax=Thiohalorhabdus methylotrophus TaxID=3242694 RepID=A0ABV4TY13_9GAMM